MPQLQRELSRLPPSSQQMLASPTGKDICSSSDRRDGSVDFFKRPGRSRYYSSNDHHGNGRRYLFFLPFIFPCNLLENDHIDQPVFITTTASNTNTSMAFRMRVAPPPHPITTPRPQAILINLAGCLDFLTPVVHTLFPIMTYYLLPGQHFDLLRHAQRFAFAWRQKFVEETRDRFNESEAPEDFMSAHRDIFDRLLATGAWANHFDKMAEDDIDRCLRAWDNQRRTMPRHSSLPVR